MINNILEKYTNLKDQITDKLIYRSGIIHTPFANNINIIYADYIASGKPSPLVEEFLQTNIYPIYSNTHSNAHNGILMKNIISDTKTYIREQFNLSADYQILFTGNGTTGAINHLINCIDYSLYEEIIIYLSIYEHYSNHLPWIELIHPNKKIIYIPFESNTGIIDLEYFKSSVKNNYDNLCRSTLLICSISACSNINGMINPTLQIRDILDQFPSTDIFSKYFFSDYACSAPYVKIDGSIYDAFFFSPHKFIGGVSTPGILIGRSCLFSKSKPYCMGGGCVIKASSTTIEYDLNIEKKESAGTPNIIGIIKIKKILELKNKFQSIITHNEKLIYKLIKIKIDKYTDRYPTFQSILYNDDVKHLPILSFAIKDLHYNFIVVLFNDKFGIQTRGGIGCCGLLAEYIEKEYNIKGWCRISFHWLMDTNTILYIFKALEYIIENGHKYLKYYEYNKEQNLYQIKKLRN
jgi:selenocysteine lyase/cysteine desulfurase